MKTHWSFALPFAILSCCGFGNELSPPNILLITADDLGIALSSYGEKRFTTPSIDARAAEGVRFEFAYAAQSSCSPSRAALLTGRWPHQNGQYGLSHLGFRMHEGEKTLPAVLKAAGYFNGIMGKLHVEPEADFPFDWKPEPRGHAAVATRSVRWVAEQSRQFFVQAKESGRPFFYYVNYFDPHGPWEPEIDQVEGIPENPRQAEDIQDSFPSARSSESRKQSMATFQNSVLRLDHGIGLLLNELSSAGLAEKTMVIFVADNGGAWASTSATSAATPYPGKGISYELGVRVSLLVRWPGVASAGQVRRELVSLIDVMPTVLTAVGVTVPGEVVGEPLQPLLRDEKVDWREYLFTEMNFHGANTFRPQRSVRNARYKLLLRLAPEANLPLVEMYDVQVDPVETTNRADDPELARTRARLEAALEKHHQTTRDPLIDPARLERWKIVAAEWRRSAPREQGDPDSARVPEGGLAELER